MAGAKSAVSVCGLRIDDSVQKLGYLDFPADLSGKTVLDIGAFDGFFSFEAERRGSARVVAADYFCWTLPGMGDKQGFNIAHAALNSKVEAVLIPVEEMSPEKLGMFDLVLFLGVLYHSQYPLRYLRIVRSRHLPCRRPTNDGLGSIWPGCGIDVPLRLRNTNKQPEKGSARSFSWHNWASESMPSLPSTASIATRTRICGVIWITLAPTGLGSARPDPARWFLSTGYASCRAALPTR